MRLGTLVACVLLLAAIPGVRAQTDEHEQEDKAYQQRLTKPTPPPLAADPRAATIATADKLIRDGQDYKSKSTAHWQVRTDDALVDAAASAALLESFRTWFQSFWKGRLETTPSEELGRVYVFTSFHDYNELLTGGALHGDFRPAGHYNLVTDVVALYLGAIDRAGLPDTLVHEGAHMLIAREILHGRSTAPWLAEGLAAYFESTARDGKGGFEAGAVGGRQAKERLRNLKKLLDAKPPWSVTSLLDTDDPQVFYGEGATERYAAAWVVVHALFHADGGSHAAGFAKFVSEAAASGVTDPERLYELTGLDAAKLTALVAADARAIDVR